MSPSKIREVLVGIAAGTMTRKYAASYLGVADRTVTRMMRKHGVIRPESDATKERRERKKRVSAKEKLKNTYIPKVLSDEMTAEEAAAHCEVTLRTIYRWIGDEKDRLVLEKMGVSKPKIVGKRKN